MDVPIFERTKQRLTNAGPFPELFQLELIEADDEKSRIRMQCREDLEHAFGAMHGGALMSFADIASVVWAHIHTKGQLAGTQQFSINFLRQASGKYIDAISEVVHNGRTSLVVQTTLENDAGECVALITQTQAVRPLEQ